MKKVFWISTLTKRYPIMLRQEASIWTDIIRLKKKYPQSRFFLITDSKLHRHYKKELANLTKHGFHVLHFHGGEASKTEKTKAFLEAKLFKAGCNRQDLILALGGGVVGDLAGFIAATYMRGLRYIAIPTSLIAMVDSSIGGKTGLDTPFGKNLIGAFHHPEAVWIDTSFLKTLPNKEYRSGLAEVVKYAFIDNTKLYQTLSLESEAVLACEATVIHKIITNSIRTKVHVVNHDEMEMGYRRILNFGHTLGHAIEHLSAYSINHGWSISLGMAIEAWLSYKMKLLSAKDLSKVIAMLRKLQLPVIPTDLTKSQQVLASGFWKTKKLYTAMQVDKKNTQNSIRFSALKAIGAIHANRGSFVVNLETAFFQKAFREFNTHPLIIAGDKR